LLSILLSKFEIYQLSQIAITIMIETNITITVNRKPDIELIEQKIIQRKIQSPVYIREYEFSFQVSFTSDYEEWELDSAILNCFPEYEYTEDLERGRKEIRLIISRYQSELSTDDWGRPIENPLNETKYLVKKSVKKAGKFNTKIKVLFEDREQFYFINIVNDINKKTQEQGFLLLNDFKTNNEDNSAEILKDQLYKTSSEAFDSGLHRMSNVVDNDFSLYLENKKKEIEEIQKLPRKIIRDFIKAYNNLDERSILKNLDERLVYERRVIWQTISTTNGLDEFKKFFHSHHQTLSGRNLKISSWTIELPRVTISVKYLPISETRPLPKYGQIRFLLENNKIIDIIDES
jgi:hypothetical protein